MRFWKWLAWLVCCWVPVVAQALDLSAYQTPQGAITVHRSGDVVDPYFAMKALWSARQLGDAAPQETQQWINWLLPRQKEDGSFARYCAAGQAWQACADADADDSMLALWIELLYEAAPARLPPRWADSLHRAERALERLKDPRSGVYRVSSSAGDALLMDNSEIYAALRRVADIRLRAQDRTGAKRYQAQADALRKAMAHVFHAADTGLLAWSSGDLGTEAFYPHRLAHLYPWMHGMATESFGAPLSWNSWLDRYGDAWLARTDELFPWGLVAQLAYQQGQYQWVEKWLDQAVALRDSGHWNVLEEALLQGLARHRLGGHWQ